MSGGLHGLIEAGGTKFVLGIATSDGEILATHRIPTTTPEETVGATVDWLARQGDLTGIGVATFGPVELDRASPDWGHILATPKAGWSGADLVGPLARFGCPVALDTDVNAAALAEAKWGAGRGERVVIYFTVGTGFGGGAVIDNRTLRGLTHPEMGHMRVPRHPDDREFPGHCQFHGDCLEGLACGPAIIARWGASLDELPAGHPAQDIVAWYIAQAVVTMQSIFEPGCIVIGGGVSQAPGLIERVRTAAEELGGGYFRSRARDIVRAPGLGEMSGLLGALALSLTS